MTRAPLELCPVCENGNLYRYDFDKRCCRARFTAKLPKASRLQRYQGLAEKYGLDYANAHIEDVNEFRRIKAGEKTESDNINP